MIKKQGRNELCSCGSGLKYKHCCGGRSITISAAQNVAGKQDTFQNAWQLHQRGYLDQALNIYNTLVAKQPNDAKVLYLVGAIYRAQGQTELAWKNTEASIKKGFNDPAALLLYCELLVEKQFFKKAETIIIKLLKKQPSLFEATRLAANIYFELGQYSDAERWYKKTLLLNQTDDSVHHNLAKTLRKRNRDTDAISHYEIAFSLNPKRIENLISLTTVLEQNNQLEKSESYASLVLDLEPFHFNALIVRSKLSLRKKAYAEALLFLDKIKMDLLSESENVEMLNQRALVHDKMGEFSSAFSLQHESNKCLSDLRNNKFEFQTFTDQLQKIEQLVDKIDWQLMPTEHSFKRLSVTPIFIVGFFRSGTTLIHQVLSSHPEIVGAGELNFMERLEIQLKSDFGENYLLRLGMMPVPQRDRCLSKLRKQYLAMLKVVSGNYDKKDARFIVDKFPFNLKQLPLIKLVFPEAPVVHIFRRPVDTVLSCYFTIFQDEYSWSDNFVETAEVYSALHQHAVKIKNIIYPTLHELKYEDLVNDFEAKIKFILSLVGVPWSENCLNFHLNTHIPRTPSYAQVTKKIYLSSLDRAKSYKELIPDEALSMLSDADVDLGYS